MCVYVSFYPIIVRILLLLEWIRIDSNKDIWTRRKRVVHRSSVLGLLVELSGHEYART